MFQPPELKSDFSIDISNEKLSTTDQVWKILSASYKGYLAEVKELVVACPELAYAQYNYTPPIHFAVREGHEGLVKYLLEKGAWDPAYRTFPFLDDLKTIAEERDFKNISTLLEDYRLQPERVKFRGDCGKILFKRTEVDTLFEKAVDENNITEVEKLLKKHPQLAKDETFFWGEGILMMPAKENNQEMMVLLLSYGARVPKILKWAQFYYFENIEAAAYLLIKGMNPNTKSWQGVTLLHDMAQKGNIEKAELLIKHGADLNSIEEEYQSTPLGLACRWGNLEMVEYLLKQGVEPNKSGKPWSRPLEWARRKGHFEISDLLLRYGAE